LQTCWIGQKTIWGMKWMAMFIFYLIFQWVVFIYCDIVLCTNHTWTSFDEKKLHTTLYKGVGKHKERCGKMFSTLGPCNSDLLSFKIHTHVVNGCNLWSQDLFCVFYITWLWKMGRSKMCSHFLIACKMYASWKEV
jgi:hypothetical protein